MKKSLGKIGVILLLMQTLLLSDQLATYSLSSDKKSAMVKEPVVITFKVSQKSSSDRMFFLFTPLKSPDYEIQLLKSLNDDTLNHQAKASFSYLLFPLKAKKIEVKFNFSIQTASDEALAQSYVDDHDGGKAIEKVNHPISLKSLTIDVMPTPKNIDLYGDFTLSSKSDRTKIAPYEDINLLYTIKGEGYKNETISLFHKIPNVTLFKDIHNVYSKITKNGYQTQRVYTYALSDTEDFTVPALHLNAYSFSKHKAYTLDTPAYHIHVKAIDIQTLLDKSDSPMTTPLLSLEIMKQYFIYIVIFLFGFISAKLSEINIIKRVKNTPFEDIKNTQTAQELILLLLNNYKNMEIKEYVERLEKIAYKQSSQSFHEVKKEILELFSK